MTTATKPTLADLQQAVAARREEEELLQAQLVELSEKRQATLDETARANPEKLKQAFKIGGSVASIEAKAKKAEARLAHIALEVPALERALREEAIRVAEEKMEEFRQRVAEEHATEEAAWIRFGELYADLMRVYINEVIPAAQAAVALKQEAREAGLVTTDNDQEWDSIAKPWRRPFPGNFATACEEMFSFTADPGGEYRTHRQEGTPHGELAAKFPDLRDVHVRWIDGLGSDVVRH